LVHSRAGELKGLTGVDAPSEPPESPDLVKDTTSADIDQLVAQVIDLLNARRQPTTAAEPRQPT
jgi:bifunctional enzyme CysN/CysC